MSADRSKTTRRPLGAAVPLLVSVALLAAGPAAPAAAQTLTDSLAAAYDNNSRLNAARSDLRATDEAVAIARSGNRPNIAATARARTVVTQTEGARPPIGGPRRDRSNTNNELFVGVTLTQPLFDGFQTRNNTREAEALVRARRASLVNTEQAVLLDAAAAFLNVIAFESVVELRLSDIRFLEEQVRAARDRFEVGEGTRTDVSQAEARLAEAQAAYNRAIADLEFQKAVFREVTGITARSLRNNITVDRFLPASLQEALSIGLARHPAIVAAIHNVDVALFNARAIEGERLPSVNLEGQAGTTFFLQSRAEQLRQDSASVGLNVSIPIYQSGLVSARTRQAKEQLGSARIQVDRNRDEVRRNIARFWAEYRAAQASILAAQTGVFAAQLALDGVIEEQRVGQRTTLDVLNSQRDLVDAQLTLVQAERDADLAGYQLLSAIGRLTARNLGLSVVAYNPEEHYEAVRDKWHGFRTPDGR